MGYRIVLISIILCASIFAQSDQRVQLDKIKAQYFDSPEFLKISEKVFALQKSLSEKFGIQEVYLGGGSIRAILDYVYFGKEINIRDLDVFMVLNRHADKEFGHVMGRSLEGNVLGTYDPEAIYNKAPSRPDTPTPEINPYSAGQNLYFRSPDVPYYIDLGVFYSPKDLELNGLFDVDTLRLRLDHQTSLSDFVKSIMTKNDYSSLLRQGHIIEAKNAYQNWIKGKPYVIHWSDIFVEPSFHSMRLIRTYSTVGISSYPSEVRENLKPLVNGDRNNYGSEFLRNLLKVFKGPAAAQELLALNELGTFNQWAPSLSKFLSRHNVESLEKFLNAASPTEGTKNDPLAVGRWLHVIKHLEVAEKVYMITLLLQLEPELNKIKAKLAASINCRHLLIGMMAFQ